MALMSTMMLVWNLCDGQPLVDLWWWSYLRTLPKFQNVLRAYVPRCTHENGTTSRAAHGSFDFLLVKKTHFLYVLSNANFSIRFTTIATRFLIKVARRKGILPVSYSTSCPREVHCFMCCTKLKFENVLIRKKPSMQKCPTSKLCRAEKRISMGDRDEVVEFGRSRHSDIMCTEVPVSIIDLHPTLEYGPISNYHSKRFRLSLWMFLLYPLDSWTWSSLFRPSLSWKRTFSFLSIASGIS